MIKPLDISELPLRNWGVRYGGIDSSSSCGYVVLGDQQWKMIKEPVVARAGFVVICATTDCAQPWRMGGDGMFPASKR